MRTVILVVLAVLGARCSGGVWAQEDDRGSGRDASILGTEMRICEVRIDTDLALYEHFASTSTTPVIDLVAQVERWMVPTYKAFLAEGVDIQLLAIRVRVDDDDDPYGEVDLTGGLPDPDAMLELVDAEWYPDSEADVVHLISGVSEFSGDTTHASAIGSICELSYEESGCELIGGFTSALDEDGSFRGGVETLIAHGIGHSLGMHHCDATDTDACFASSECDDGSTPDDSCEIMCEEGSCADASGTITFGAEAACYLAETLDLLTGDEPPVENCLDVRPEVLSLPFEEDFGSTLDADAWLYATGSAVLAGLDARSGSYVGELLGSDLTTNLGQELRSSYIDLSGESEVFLSLVYQHRGVEEGERLIVEYLSSDLGWEKLGVIVSTGEDLEGSSGWTLRMYAVHEKDGALHDLFRFRIRAEGDEADDLWWVDCVWIEDEVGSFFGDPEVDSLSPDGGSIDGGSITEIRGKNLPPHTEGNALEVTFFRESGSCKGSETVTTEEIEWVDSSLMRVRVPAWEAGACVVDVSVDGVNGSDTVADGFVYTDLTFAMEDAIVWLPGADSCGADGYGDYRCFSLETLMSTTLDVVAYSVGASCSEELEVLGVTLEGTDAEDAETVISNIDESGRWWTLGVILSKNGLTYLAGGDEVVIARTEYAVVEEPKTFLEASIELGPQGDPPVQLLAIETEGTEVSASVTGEGVVRISFENGFLRGDCNGDGTVSGLLDSLFLLRYLFTSGDAPPCLDAADIDDSGTTPGLLDPIYLLAFAFNDGPEPPAPGTMSCGPDPSVDELDCETQAEECEP